jgi:hypothetical protein
MTDPRPEEFRRFHELLVEHAPDGYRPWYFRVRQGSKAPGTSGSWKDDDARLSVEEAIEWMEDGGNVGIAGTADDALVNVDIDDEEETTPGDLKDTLIARSRSRTGVHAWYFAAPDEDIPNIPTDNAGEIRAEWQYVVAPGSYVDTDPTDVPEEYRDDAGYYTVEKEAPVTSLRFSELPAVFREHQKETEQENEDAELQHEIPGGDEDRDDGNDSRQSALFNIDAEDVVRKEGGSTKTDDRWSALFHGSDTDANMSVSSKGLIQCWRHSVTHNGFQALVVLSDYNDGCKQVGAAHKKSKAGPSSIANEDGAHVWHAWKYAKENDYIPDDDPVPYSALRHLCRDRDLCAMTEIPDSPEDGSIPAHAYDAALKTIEEHDDLDPGRVPTDEIDDGDGVPDKPNIERVDESDGSDAEKVQQDAPAESASSGGSDDDEHAISSSTTLEVYDGGYGYFHTNDDGDTWFERVTNFTLDVDSFLFKDGDRIIDMKVVPGSGEESYDLTVPAKVFNDARRFRDNVVLGLSTTFEGAPSDLNELRKLVAAQDAPQRQGTHHMGLHPDTGEFVTPSGVLTADGWTDDPQMAYIERDIGAERSNLLHPDEVDAYDPEEVADILELLPQTRNAERFLPVLGWLYTAPLRPYVDEWEGQFNTLHVTGETGAGKSSTLSLAWQLLGMDGDPMACDDTKFALTTNMASTNSIPMWFDEYKPGDMKDWELDRFQTLMRKSTRGGVETRGNADKSTEEYRLQAPLMISGEQAVQGAAEERRSIQTRFRDNVKEPRSTTKRAFAELTGMAYDAGGETKEPAGFDLQQHALAYYRFVLQTDEVLLRGLWGQARERVRELLTEHDITGVDDLPQQGIQTVQFGMMLYRRFAEHVATEAGIETPTVPTDGEIETALLYIARQYGDDGSRKSHLDRFVELTSRAAAAEYLEAGEHFTTVNEGAPDEQLALKLPRVHDSVSKYVRDHGLSGEDLLNSSKDYQDRMKEAADDASSYVDTHSKNTRPLNRCARLDPEAAEEQLQFDASPFGFTAKEVETQDGDEDGGTQPEHPEPAPIGEIDPSKQDVASIIGSVEFKKFDGRSTQEGTPAWTATLSDETGEAELVVWDEEDIPQMYDSTGLFEPEVLHVKGAETGQYDGKVQFVVGGETAIERAQLGSGATAGETPDEDQDQLDSSTQAKAEADGGQVSDVVEDAAAAADDDQDVDPRPKIVHYVRQHQDGDVNGVERSELVTVAGQEWGVGTDRVRGVLDSMVESGKLNVVNKDGLGTSEDDRYRVNR